MHAADISFEVRHLTNDGTAWLADPPAEARVGLVAPDQGWYETGVASVCCQFGAVREAHHHWRPNNQPPTRGLTLHPAALAPK
jgi:hypothetical protein